MGIIQMVHLRGGSIGLGPDGVLGLLLAESIFNPAFQTLGPSLFQ
jgi:hypothetical protein